MKQKVSLTIITLTIKGDWSDAKLLGWLVSNCINYWNAMKTMNIENVETDLKFENKSWNLKILTQLLVIRYLNNLPSITGFFVTVWDHHVWTFRIKIRSMLS